MPSNDHWIEGHLKYLHALKSLSQQQQRFIELATLDKRTALEEKQFKSALKLEKLTQQMVSAKAESAKLNNAAKKEERKARDHELYNSAGLLILSRLVDTVSGKPTRNPAGLLGALMGLEKVPMDDKRWDEWTKIGNEKFAANKKVTSQKKAIDDA
jgi:hypothetical protein